MRKRDTLPSGDIEHMGLAFPPPLPPPSSFLSTFTCLEIPIKVGGGSYEYLEERGNCALDHNAIDTNLRSRCGMVGADRQIDRQTDRQITGLLLLLLLRLA
jgi:hypothetical protein